MKLQKDENKGGVMEQSPHLKAPEARQKNGGATQVGGRLTLKSHITTQQGE